MPSIQSTLSTPRAATRPPFRPGDGLCSCPSLLTSRLGISFAYYGVILASAELLERDLVCGSRSESEVVVTEGVSEESQSPCHCHMFAPSDYQTMIISTIGEIARKCLCVGWLSVSGWGACNGEPCRRVTCHTLGSCLVELNNPQITPMCLQGGWVWGDVWSRALNLCIISIPRWISPAW